MRFKETDVSSPAQAPHKRHVAICTPTLAKDTDLLLLSTKGRRSQIREKDNIKMYSRNLSNAVERKHERKHHISISL
jgi:hypothetical protein